MRLNREPIRSPARSVANTEFHQTGDRVNETAHSIVTALGDRGVRAVNPAMGFPMEMDRIGSGKVWVVSHKPVAVAAGLGHMRQAKHSAGMLGGRLMLEAHWAFWTATVWESEEAMRAFRSSGAHMKALPKLLDWCDEASRVDRDCRELMR